MRIIVRAFLPDDDDERVSPCGYACACCTGYSDRDIKKLTVTGISRYKIQIIY